MLLAFSLDCVTHWRGYSLSVCDRCHRPGVMSIHESKRVLRWWQCVLWESNNVLYHAICCPHCGDQEVHSGGAADFHHSDDPHVLIEVCRPKHRQAFLEKASSL
ncbi:hypothetical protein K2X85_19585 [bacterium]|nr:hypothetical protein [bacterium]